MSDGSQASRPNPHHLRVIGATLPRTGSMSMYEAMNELGIKSHHMKEVFMHRDQIPLWKKAYSSTGLTPQEWDILLKDYEAVHDAPACQFVKELAILNPDAKVIITKRDPKKWKRSLSSTVCWIAPGLDLWAAKLSFVKEWSFLNLADEIWWGKKGIFPGKKEIDENALQDYVSDIQEFFEKRGESHRVLVFETGSSQDGYDIICPFLGLPKPEGKKWPNVNASSGSENAKASEKVFEEKSVNERKAKVANMKRLIGGLGLAGAVGGIALVAIVWQRTLRR